MRKLTVSTGDAMQEVSYSPGPSLRDILDEARLPVRSGCRGNGACGLCLVQIEAGDVNNPTSNERAYLSAQQLERKTRLACQVMPEGDLRVRRINPIRASNWRALPDTRVQTCTPNGSVDYALAVDLGTTHISAAIWDVHKGRRLCGRIGPNPQSRFGADVMTRLIAAGESYDIAGELARMPLDAIGECLRDMESRECVRVDQIRQVGIVGNTAMIALLSHMDPHALLKPSSWTRPIQCPSGDAKALASRMGVHPEATVEVVAPLGGFVGSDLLVGVLCTGLTDRPGSLLIDFGTNSEMALWDGSTLWVTSAAGGPAFECCGIRCGMQAEPGAIYHVARQEGSPELRFHILDGVAAKGFCGSGLVDLIAVLRETGELTSAGKFATPQAADGFMVHDGEPAIRLTTQDVDTFQRAKAGIGVGIRKLMAAARLAAADLNRICVCGVFGEHLDCRNAQTIGLLPDVPIERIELCGNTALAGCERLLLSPVAASDLESLRQRASIVGLSEAADFDMLFLESLYLRPLRAGAL